MPHLFPLQFLLTTCAGWVHRQQSQAIDYLIEENRVLKEQLGDKRLRLTNDQRRRLAAKGKALGRRLLTQVATIVTPDTIAAAARATSSSTHDSADCFAAINARPEQARAARKTQLGRSFPAAGVGHA